MRATATFLVGEESGFRCETRKWKRGRRNRNGNRLRKAPHKLRELIKQAVVWPAGRQRDGVRPGRIDQWGPTYKTIHRAGIQRVSNDRVQGNDLRLFGCFLQ
ncbi:hypothetical protein B296_00038262, partial [Ensete ventricosum]